MVVIVLESSAVKANVAPAQGMPRVVDRPLLMRLLRFQPPPPPYPSLPPLTLC